MQYVSVFDLIVISVWALFAIWNREFIPFLIPVAILRLYISFALSHRHKNVVWFIAAFVMLFVLLLGLQPMDPNKVVLQPFAKMYDCLVSLFRGHSTMLEGAYHYYGNHGHNVPFPGNGWTVWILLWLSWIVVEPIVAYTVLVIRKSLVVTKWPLKKVLLSIFYYVAFLLFLAGYKYLRFDWQLNTSYLWGLFFLLFPLVLQVGKKNIPMDVSRYGAVTIIFAIALSAGFVMDTTFSLVAILISTVLFYYFVGIKWSESSLPDSSVLCIIYPIVISGFLFWAAQYTEEGFCVLLLLASAVCMGYVAIKHYRRTHNVAVSILVFFVCSFILPSISIGYNRYNGIETKRWFNFRSYYYSSRGLLYVHDDGAMGLRDRFGLIMPCKHEWVAPMGNKMKPFVKFQDDMGWGIFDLERQEVIVQPEYRDIFEYDHNVWRLVSEEEENDQFFIGPKFYYRYSTDNSRVSDSPSGYEPSTHLCLRYDHDIPHSDDLDKLLYKMVESLSLKNDSVSYADFYWNWGLNITAGIDSLNVYAGLFESPDSSRYDMAMDAIAEYIHESCGGNQPEMNCWSYVMAVIENYRMIHTNQSLADSLPDLDMRREYTLYNEYMVAMEEWESRLDAAFGENYSSKPMDVNATAEYRFKKRRQSLEEVLKVLSHKQRISCKGKVSDRLIQRHFDDMAKPYRNTDLGEYYVENIRYSFRNWMDFRNEIAAKMRGHLSTAYRNQTENLKHELIYGD